MATKSATHTGSSWVLLAVWSALIAIAASYYYSKETIRRVNTLIEGIEHLVKINFPR
jgi:hypothetical protein